MIKINLLGAPKPKRGGKRIATTTVTDMTGMGMGGGGGEGPNPIFIILGVCIIAMGAVWWMHLQATNKAEQLQQAIAKEEQENRRLSAVKAKYDQEQKVRDNYERRVKVIDDLRASQTGGPVNLLTMIGDTVNNTDAVWLNVMQDKGGSIDIEGTALSSTAVANLIKNLQKTGYFKSVEMTETSQDPSSKDLQEFIFKLSCEKQKS
ncbi:MAG TPA: PilN domain-containing protein [Terriglobales bacterium]|jgi:Tfp pilus assembly protein PilN|nr:PilN domain-containing protein [Terriglobales bacterium]